MLLFPGEERARIHRGDAEPEFRLKHMKAKAEKCCKLGRISAAPRILDDMEPLLNPEGPQPAARAPLSADDMTGLVTNLFPRASEADILPPVDVASIEVTSEEVHETLRRLKTDKAAGHSGWTNRILRKLATTGTDADQELFAARLARVCLICFLRVMLHMQFVLCGLRRELRSSLRMVDPTVPLALAKFCIAAWAPPS
jgi:hypothetical protein